jgi:hypothetical protein
LLFFGEVVCLPLVEEAYDRVLLSAGPVILLCYESLMVGNPGRPALLFSAPAVRLLTLSETESDACAELLLLVACPAD